MNYPTRLHRWVLPLLTIAALMVAAPAARAQTPPPHCTIDGATTISEGGTFHLCGPEGAGYTYTWKNADDVVLTHNRCVEISGLAPGEYDYEFTISLGPEYRKCPVHLTVTPRGQTPPPDCGRITGSRTIQAGGTFHLCGPEGAGYTYTWKDPNGVVLTHDRCVSISGLAPGEYDYEFTISLGPEYRKCPIHLTVTSGENPPPTCDGITGATTVQAGGTFNLCGPAGTGYTYTWKDPNGVVLTHDRCVSISGLAPGEYDYEFTISQGPAYKKCPVHLTVTSGGGGGDLICPDFKESVCDGYEFELCGQEGNDLTYSWSGDGINGTKHTRCVTVGPFEPGHYTIVYVVSRGQTTKRCELDFTVKECEPNCPRDADFWRDQCNNDVAGSPSGISEEELQLISDCVFVAYDLPKGFDLFCTLVSSRATDARSKAKREFVATLANICAGDLGLDLGEKISLAPETRVRCGSETMSLAELIFFTNAKFRVLAGASLDDPAVRAQYEQIAECFGKFNSGRGIGPVCKDGDEDGDDDGDHDGDDDGDDDDDDGDDDGDDDDGDDDGQSSVRIADRLSAATPNPFATATRLTFTIPAGETRRVEIGVYDVSGRLLRSLASGEHAAGSYDIRWNGLAADGSRSRSGIYFVRGAIGAERVVRRVVFLK